jgi:DNA-binding protein HU-beta
VNKGELVKLVAERAELNPLSARRAVDAVIDSISERLGAGEDVVLTGFGKFSVVDRAEREGVNPREPGTRIRIPARRSPRFTPGTQLRTTVAAGPDAPTVLDPVSLMVNQPTKIVPSPSREAEPQAPGVAIVAGQSEGPGIVPTEEAKPKSGARSRKSAAAGSGASSAKASGGSAGKGSGASSGKSAGKSAGKSTGKATGKSSGASAPKTTTRRSGSRRTKES